MKRVVVGWGGVVGGGEGRESDGNTRVDLEFINFPFPPQVRYITSNY